MKNAVYLCSLRHISFCMTNIVTNHGPDKNTTKFIKLNNQLCLHLIVDFNDSMGSISTNNIDGE